MIIKEVEMCEKEEPFYSEKEFRERLEKLKERVKKKLESYDAYYSMAAKNRWDWIYPELDKELLTYEQKKIVAREFFSMVEEIVKKLREEEKRQGWEKK
jgi:transcriptional regulator of heat shock response